MRKFLAAMAICAAPIPGLAATPVCGDARAHLLDFWIGDWRVTDAKDDSFQGEDRVERVLGGCAVTEDWKGAGAGDEGKSLFAYNAQTHQWNQVWVTLDTSRPGGLKYKRLVGAQNGGTRFQGDLDLPDGRIILDRTTLTPMPDGRVHQLIEDSKDGGTSWITSFDAIYAKK